MVVDDLLLDGPLLNEALLKGLRQGEAASYETLVRHFETPLYRYFLASHGNPQLAGEQSADCFGELVRALPKMSGGPEQLRPFIFSVARNVLRREWRRPSQKTVPLEAAAEAIDAAASPDKTVEDREELDRMLQAIRSLDPPTRDVFLLRFVEQMSLAQVATAVGEPLGTVKSRIHRGRQRLQAIIQPLFDSTVDPS